MRAPAVLEGRPRELGDGFAVRRVLPAAQRRLVGPFIFFDHFGPVTFPPGGGVNVRPHPHINLATVTWLFEGELVHRDSLGSHQAIRPGEVNWMNAGRGIVHSERTDPAVRARGPRIHGLQAWVALPGAAEESPPAFEHHDAGALPRLTRDGATLCVAAGRAYGAESPVRTHSPLFYVEARLGAGAALPLPDDHAERAVYVAEGRVTVGDTPAEVGQMVVVDEAGAVVVRAEGPALVMLLGGARLDGPRHIWWNFVSSRPERIEQARQDWRDERFPTVPGDDRERIPLPD